MSGAPVSPEGLATEVAFRPVALGGATVTFAVIGATSSLYGPLLVAFSHRFQLSLPSAGAVLSVHFVGALLGVPLAWLGVKRLSGALVLSGALSLVALGAFGAAVAAHWSLLLASVFLIGLGYGGLDFTLNTLLTRTRATGRAHRLSVVNAGFGVGAVVGPLLIIAAHPAHFAPILAGIGAMSLVLIGANRGVHAPALRAEENQRVISAMRAERRPILFTFIGGYVLYIAVETSAAGWMASHLHGLGYSQSVASLVTAGFWAGVALGRVLGAPAHRRWSERTLVLGGLALAALLGLVALVAPLAPYAYALMGLVVALVFPMGLIWYTSLCPHDSDGVALMILFMMAGGIIGPGAQSLLVAVAGIHVVPLVVTGFALADLGLFASALRFTPLVTR